MTGRNRAIAIAGLSKLDTGLDAVLKLLPPARQEAIARHIEAERSRDATGRAARTLASRKIEQKRIERIAMAGGISSAQDIDPRLRGWLIDRLVTSHGRG